MPRFKDDEIAAYHVGSKMVCRECITSKELKDLKADDIITTDETEDEEELFFCDRCKERIG